MPVLISMAANHYSESRVLICFFFKIPCFFSCLGSFTLLVGVTVPHAEVTLFKNTS